MKFKISDISKVLIFLALLAFGLVLVWKMWGADCYDRFKERRLEEELAIIHDSTMAYSDPMITEIILSAKEIEDTEAKYHSLWFIDAVEDGKDDAVMAVFEKDNGDMNVYISYVNPAGNYNLSWEKKAVKSSGKLLTQLLPKQMDNPKNYASYAIRCDGMTVFPE